MEEIKYFIYIIYAASSGKYYVGHSKDPFRRVVEHNSKDFNTYTSKYRPWSLAGFFYCPGIKSDAMKMEKFIKKQKSQTLIDRLLDPDFSFTGILAQLVIPYLRDGMYGINQMVIP